LQHEKYQLKSSNNLLAITAPFYRYAIPVKLNLLPDKLTLTLVKTTIKSLLA